MYSINIFRPDDDDSCVFYKQIQYIFNVIIWSECAMCIRVIKYYLIVFNATYFKSNMLAAAPIQSGLTVGQ